MPTKAHIDVMSCPACEDMGWVCEDHDDRPWGIHPRACQCGGAGMPCEACNPSGGIDEPPAISPIARVTYDMAPLAASLHPPAVSTIVMDGL